MAPRSGEFEESSITYEQLSELEREFDDADAVVLRHQIAITRPLFKKREEMVAQIPNFWPLVWEQAPPEVDEYIQPTDANVLLSHLTKLTVRHFEVDGNAPNGAAANGSASAEDGEPRSVAFRFEFSENEYFSDSVLEKKFHYRRARDGWAGLVSEPVEIHWRSSDKDLTDGLVSLSHKVWQLEQECAAAKTVDAAKKGELDAAHAKLKKRVEDTPLGGLSFFAWFAFRGRPVSEEENALALERDRKVRAGEAVEPLPEDSDEEDWEEQYEIFPTGEELAIAISEDLWPEALKYFAQAQERDAASDASFESDFDSDEEDSWPAKRSKA
jgi:hypothetical protein